jgi:DNA-binding transcriptional LysR family regulator
MDRLLSMRVFQRVLDEGGFAAAARALDMSPAGVTRLVADLEDHLGARLLQRTTRRVSLTEAGTAYLARIRHILQDIDEADAVATAHTKELAGTLRVLVPPVMAVHILAPLVAGFRTRYPLVLLDIDVDAPLEPPIEDYDITLLGADASFDANVIARPIISSHAVMVASPAYLATRPTPLHPQDLQQHDCLRLKQSGSRPRHWHLIEADAPERTLDIAVHPVLWANHTDTLLRATLDGAGISAQPVDLVAAYLAQGQLQRVLAPWITGHFTLYAALPSRKFMPQRTRVFLEYLTEQTRATVARAQHI